MRSPFVKFASRHLRAVRRPFALRTAFLLSAAMLLVAPRSGFPQVCPVELTVTKEGNIVTTSVGPAQVPCGNNLTLREQVDDGSFNQGGVNAGSNYGRWVECSPDGTYTSTLYNQCGRPVDGACVTWTQGEESASFTVSHTLGVDAWQVIESNGFRTVKVSISAGDVRSSRWVRYITLDAGDIRPAPPFELVPYGAPDPAILSHPAGSPTLNGRLLLVTGNVCGLKWKPKVVSLDENQCPIATGKPIQLLSGNETYTERDPLPGGAEFPFTRTYDSLENLASPHEFGYGWRSPFNVRFFSMYPDAVSNDGHVVTIILEDNSRLVFEESGGGYQQLFPLDSRDTLSYDPIDGLLTLRQGETDFTRRFSGGKLHSYRHLPTGRDALLTYDADGRPVRVADSWGVWAWNVVTDAATNRTSSISVEGRPDLTWTYTTANGDLTEVRVGGQLYRSYTYSGHKVTAIRDGDGRLIASFGYDSQGRAISSSSQVENITNIQYGIGTGDDKETITRVTYASGSVADFSIRYVGGRAKLMNVSGGCPSCGASDTIYARNDNGSISREQDPRGYITVRDWIGNNPLRVLRGYRPAACDPETDPNRCRLTPFTLKTEPLVPTSASTTLDYTYLDPAWSEKPTEIRTASVLSPAQPRRETFVYHATTGESVSQTVTGWSGSPAAETTRTTTTALYNGTEGAVFDPGGAFSTSWLTLPQPKNRKSVDGSRADVADLTELVYYPIDAAVPDTWRGQLAAVRNAAGLVTRWENYDVFGNAARVTDPNGVVTETTYDLLGRVLSTTLKGAPGCDTAADPLCATDLTSSRSFVSTAGALGIESRAAGGVTKYEYEGLGRVSAISRGPSAGDLRERIEYSYDPLTGKKSLERYLASGVERKRTSYTYYADGQLKETIHADNSKTVYAYSGEQLASVQDENHSTPNTTYAYDPLSRLTSVTQKLGAGNIVTGYVYDAHDNLTSVTDPNGNVASYIYDDFGQLLQQSSPVTGVTSYSYDSAGNLISTTDANAAATARTYDALGRILTSTSTRSGVPAESLTWSYDDATAGNFGKGRLASMTDPSGSTSYAYERRGLSRSEARSILGASYAQTYGFDASGERNRITYPSGRVVNYTFDYAGRPYSASSGATTYVSSASYEPFGPQKQVVHGNAATKNFIWDSRYRPSQNTLTGPGGTLADYSYASDNAGNITAVSDLLDAGYNRSFAYDDLSRLTTASSGARLWGGGSYAYDAMGNMTSLILGTARVSSFAFSGTTPKLSSATENGVSRAVTYDGAGNETAVGASAFAYTPGNHLDSSEGLSYLYDGRGVRAVASFAPGSLASVSIAPSPIPSGTSATGTVTLGAPAPAGGAVVTLRSSNAIAGVPGSVTVAEGTSAATFPVTTSVVGTPAAVLISATYGLSQSAPTILDPPPPEVTSLTVSPSSVAGAGSAIGTVTLTAAARSGGEVVTLSSSSSSAAVPASVTVAATGTSATFDISTSPVAATTAVTITATLGQSGSATLTIDPALILSVSASPSTLVGGNTANGSVSLASPAPAGGAVVSLSSSDTAIAAVPATVTVTAGAQAASFAVSTSGVAASSSATITATFNGTSTTAITVNPASLQSLTVNPTTVPGKTNSIATIELDGKAAAAGALVSLSSANTAVATVPGSVSVPAGSSSAPATVATSNVATATAVVLSSTYAGITRSAPLTVTPCVAGPPPPPPGSFPADEVVWFDDAGPGGALEPPPWVWDSTQKASGTQSHTDAQASGSHYHGFYNAPGTLTPGAGDKLFTYVLIDPCNPPAEITIRWCTAFATCGPRAYWGANLIQYQGEPAPYRVGDLPAAGQWVRLEVPADRVEKMGVLLTGMRFTLYGGKAWFDRAGVERCLVAPVSPPGSFPADVVWMDDDVPAGTTSQTGLIWETSQAASGTRSHTDTPKSGVHSHQVFFPVKAIGASDKLVAYVLLSPCAAPRAIMLNWLDANGLGEHRAYWGENLITGGVDGTANRYMGPLPPVGVWTRLEVTPSLVNITSTKGVYFRQYDGQAWWDWVGKNTETGAMTSQGPSLAQIEESADEEPGSEDAVAPTQEAQVSILRRSGRHALSFAATAVSRIRSLFRRRRPLALEFSYSPLPVADGPGVRETPSPLPAGEGSGVRAESTVLMAQASARPRAASTRRAPSGTIAASSYTAGDKKRFYFYTPELNLLSETETTEAAAPAIAYDYLWFAGEPLAQLNNSTGEVSYYFNDHLGTPIVQTNQQAQVVWRAEYEPYGQVFTLRSGEGRHQPLRLPGQEAEQFDSGANGVSERSYNIARWSRPSWGRYSQTDPLSVLGSLRIRQYPVSLSPSFLFQVASLGLPDVIDELSSEFFVQSPGLPSHSYSYLDGNPTNYVDPVGLERVLCTVFRERAKPTPSPYGSLPGNVCQFTGVCGNGPSGKMYRFDKSDPWTYRFIPPCKECPLACIFGWETSNGSLTAGPACFRQLPVNNRGGFTPGGSRSGPRGGAGGGW